ncbi:hypothetical protein CBR_g41032 [Chara braunii]|uniref:Integrase catalytic domain-containing protein n=1 Tax=Chara braunii TaxID=69332 RepID=A0A388LV54_CHABU|nr:hypothetical protein CBR_g41032 [Chara braunii]|eukprot:GBG86129.1 hypothetical protein CBR_g41032 [Chara braunii]
MSDHGAQQQPQVEVVMKVEGQQPSSSTPPPPPLTATQQEKMELQEQLRRQQERLAELERQEAAELEAATDHSRREYLLQQLDKALIDDRCAQVIKHLAEMVILERKITNSQFTNWDDRFERLERRVDDLAAQQSKIMDAIQNLTAQLSAGKLIAPQLPLLKPKPLPPSSRPSTPPGSAHSSQSPSHSQKASGKATYAVVAAGDQRGPKIPAPNKFRGDDPKTDVGDWAAGTKAYLRGFVCVEQTKVATVLGLLEGPALKWATSTSSSQQHSMEDWAFGLGVDKLLQALEDRFADKERARKAADRIARLGQQRYSGTLQALFAEFEQLTSTPGLVMSTDDLLTSFCRAAPEKFVVALYRVGHKDWRSFGRATLDMEAKLHVQAPSSDRRKGAFPRGGRKGKAAFTHAGSGSGSDSDSQADAPSAGTGSAAETNVAAALTQAVLGVLQQQKKFSPTTASASAKGKEKGRRPSSSQRPNLPKDEPFGLPNQLTKHHIELLPEAVPPKGRIYRMSPAELEELRKQLETLTSKGWIRPNTSEFGAPVLFVPKGNGEFRMCIDYRGLNKITRKSTEPLPRIDDLLDMVQGCTVFNKVDLKSGYHQIEMAEEDVYKTAFKTSRGEERLCIPQDRRLRTLLMSECHDARGHFGFLKSYAALLQRFFWKEMRSDMLRYVDTCELCQRNKVQRRPPLGLLKPLPIPDGPAESVSIDFTDLGKTTPRGMRQVMVCVDRFSKYAEFIPLPEVARVPAVRAAFSERWVTHHGPPTSIVSDQDPKFCSDEWQSYCKDYLHSRLDMTSGHRPEANGLAEVMKQVLRPVIFPDQQDWDLHLARVQLMYNMSVHSSTGFSPYRLHWGREPRQPLDDIIDKAKPDLTPGTAEFTRRYRLDVERARANLFKAQKAMIEQANRHRQPSSIRTGDHVRVASSELSREEDISPKLLPRYLGPWQVLDTMGADPFGPSYVIDVPLHLRTYPVFHASKLLPFTPADAFPDRPPQFGPPIPGKGYDIDRIEDEWGTGPDRQYLVRSAFQSPSENRWFYKRELLKTTKSIVLRYEAAQKGNLPRRSPRRHP